MLQTKAKPFIKWVGGKRQLIPQFKNMNLLPPIDFDINKNTYFEPFVGGGAIFFEITPINSIISDLNSQLIITYNSVKNDVEKLIEKLKTYKNEKEFFLEARNWDTNKLSEIEIASRFIYLNKTAFNGMYRVNKTGKFNVPFGKYSNPLICDEDNLRSASTILQNVKILNRGYKEVLKDAKEQDFIYLDPPYHPLNPTSSFTNYTSNGFNENDQKELRDTYIELSNRGCYVLLSNSDTEFIRELYNKEGIKIQTVQAGRAINSDSTKRGKISELIISNY